MKMQKVANSLYDFTIKCYFQDMHFLHVVHETEKSLPSDDSLITENMQHLLLIM